MKFVIVDVHFTLTMICNLAYMFIFLINGKKSEMLNLFIYFGVLCGKSLLLIRISW